MSIDKLNVYLHFYEKEVLVGQLVKNNKRILFKYSDEYLKNGYNISPLKLTFDRSIQSAESIPFGGIFGVFADSLPDAWGQLLLKKQLRNKGIAIETLSALDYLAYTGNNGLGALIYKPCIEKEDIGNDNLNLDLLDINAQEILKGKPDIIIDEIFRIGGSPGGARPKIYANYSPTQNTLTQGNVKLEKGFEPWIIKFAATEDASDIANIELAYYYMALDAGLQMNTSKIFAGVSNKKYFGTKRFDRVKSDRFHMISAAGLLHDDYQYSQMDYGTLMQEGWNLTGKSSVLEDILRVAAFNIFAHNRDDHSKNFAFLMNKNGEWSFAPAYDLTFSTSSQGQHSTICAGNGINPSSKELLELATHFSIKNAELILIEVKNAISKWRGFAEKAGVTTQSKNTIAKIIL